MILIAGQHKNPGPKVFISSTVYDLRDTRNVVAGALRLVGFEIIQSDAPGFPEQQGQAPHASCLPAVEQAQLVVAIIGKRYGKEFVKGWGDYENGTPRTPTAAEIKHAYDRNKRLFVYILKDVLAHYEIWKQAAVTPKIGEPLEGYDNFEGTMRFVQEIECLGGRDGNAPWIVPFSDGFAIVEDIRGRCSWDLEAAWRKFEAAEDDRVEQVMIGVLEAQLRFDAALLEGSVVGALRHQTTGQVLLAALEHFHQLERQVADAERRYESAKGDGDSKVLERLRLDKYSWQSQLGVARDRVRVLKRHFLLDLTVPRQTSRSDQEAELDALWNRILKTDEVVRQGNNTSFGRMHGEERETERGDA